MSKRIWYLEHMEEHLGRVVGSMQVYHPLTEGELAVLILLLEEEERVGRIRPTYRERWRREDTLRVRAISLYQGVWERVRGTLPRG